VKKALILFEAALFALLIMFLSGCVVSESSTTVQTEEIVTSTPVVQTQENTQDTSQTAGEIKEISVTAKTWEFIPDTLNFKKGDRVKLTVTSMDVEHGFAIAEYGINEKLPPNQPKVIEFTADQVGEFTIRCSVYCGEGHKAMTGKLIVTE